MHQHPDAHPAATGAAAGARAPAAHGSTGDILDADTAQAFNAAVRTAFELGEGTVSFGIRPGHASVVSPLCEVRLEGCWLGEVDGFAVSGAHGRAVGADRTVAGLELWAARSTVGEHRRVVEGITYRFRTGIPWRDQPRDHLPRRSYALAASSPGFGYWKMHPNRKSTADSPRRVRRRFWFSRHLSSRDEGLPLDCELRLVAPVPIVGCYRSGTASSSPGSAYWETRPDMGVGLSSVQG